MRLLALLAAPVLGKVFFQETFSSGWKDRWTPSTWKSETEMGEWEVSAGKHFRDQEVDSGIRTSQDARFYGLSTTFDSFSNKGKELIVQYQMKHEQKIECGGGYIKLGPKPEDLAKFGDPTPYHIMFGPDQCGFSSKRTHLILSKGGKNHLRKTDIEWVDDHKTHLFTLILRSDNSYTVNVDQKEVAKGSLKEDFDILPPKMIKDPAQSKPKDWVDEEMMDDPEDKKPEDWVEEKRIKDPKAEKPEDWDDEEDGEWEAPMIDNPDYKGDWSAKRIKNPDYKGPWVHPEIPNPDFKDDDELYAFDDISFVGFDIWQVKAGTLFDNLIITDDIEEANKLAADTWALLQPVEEEAIKAEEAKAEEEKKKEDAKKAEAKKEDDDDDLDDDKKGDDDL
jgi:calreticulin